MEQNDNAKVPELKLENFEPAAEEALKETPAAPAMPELTLEPAAPEIQLEPLTVEPIKLDYSNLSEAEKKAVKEFAQKIDINDSNMVLQYGSASQKRIADFSESALANVRTKDMNTVGDMITSLVIELKGFSPEEEQRGVKGFFNKKGRQLESMKTRYNTVEKNIDLICRDLENQKMVLLRDVAMLDTMYGKNLEYYKELTMYIMAGRERLRDVIEKDLPASQQKARASGKPEDAQAANDLANMCNRFDKKLHDLELTRVISIQMGPQIRLVQNNNSIMVEKIQSSLVNTIPLWKNQMVLALGIAHTENAVKAQREVTNLTNELLRKNADTLKTSTVEIARESERGIVDIETLRHTNQQLIATLDEVLQIQQEGTARRREAEKELGRIENELKQKLLESRDAVTPQS